MTGALVANALRPVPGYWLGVPAMIGGGLVAEAAPYFLVGTAADSVRELLRTPRDRIGLGLAVAGAAGLGVLVHQSIRAREILESALRTALGDDYRAGLTQHAADLGRDAGWGQLTSPVSRLPDDVVVARNVRYAEGQRGLLDLYHPRQATTVDAPVLLHIHGGAWMMGDKSWDGIALMHHLAARGWVCISMNYRLSPAHPFPAHLIDVKRAIAWIRENGHRYGADPSFLAVTGGSAGGHLAAMAALTPNDPAYQPGFESADTSVQAAAPRYGIYDFTGDSGTARSVSRRDKFLAPRVMMRKMATDAAAFRQASPLHRANAEAPPFFVVHGVNDTGVEVDEARYFVKRLRAVSHAPVAYAELPTTQHGFDMSPSIRVNHVQRATERFLQWAHARHQSS